MIKPTKFMNFSLTIFHIYYFVIGKLKSHFLPNNQNKALTKLSNKNEKHIGTYKLNGPITSTFRPTKTRLILHESQECANLLALYLGIQYLIFFAHILGFEKLIPKILNAKR